MRLLDNLNCTFYELLFCICVCVCSLALLCSCWMYIVIVCVMYACLRQIQKRKSTLLDTKSKTVLITGCDTGFGHFLAKRLDDHGFVVFAGVLSADSEGAHALRARESKRLHVIQLDVTSDDDVRMTSKLVQSECSENGLWGLVNNAGFGLHNDVEFATIEQYKKCAEVNLYGLIRVTKAFLPYIRKAKGRVVNISSVRGRFSWPGNSIYHVTKYGVETFSDSLRLEMRKFGVKVAIVEPGCFGGATSGCSPKQIAKLKEEVEISWNSAPEDVKTAYGREHIEKFLSWLSTRDVPKNSPEPVLDAIEDALLNSNPSTRYLVSGDSGFIIDHHVTLLGSDIDAAKSNWGKIILEMLRAPGQIISYYANMSVGPNISKDDRM